VCGSIYYTLNQHTLERYMICCMEPSRQLELFPLEDTKFKLYSGDIVSLVGQDEKHVHFKFDNGTVMSKTHYIFDIMICKNPLGFLLS
jgi:hypothetical protein